MASHCRASIPGVRRRLGLPDGRTAVIVADVVGKGVAAALLMAKLSAEARYCLASAKDAGEAISMLNDRLCRLNLDRFVTAVLVVIDPNSHQLAVANAGHMAPIHRMIDGEIAEVGVDETGLPLGIMAGHQYGQATMQLELGESLTLYTDGLNEAVSAEGEFYGIKRVRAGVKATEGSPDVLGQAIVDDVREFVGDGDQSDDMCLVAFGRVG